MDIHDESYANLLRNLILNLQKIVMEELDKCVSCWEDTEYTKGTNIHYRNFYIEGAGQLCESCYINIYGKA